MKKKRKKGEWVGRVPRSFNNMPRSTRTELDYSGRCPSALNLNLQTLEGEWVGMLPRGSGGCAVC
jgi:hypothetical protein